MRGFLVGALAWAAAAGPLGKAAFLGLYVLVCLALLPSSVLIIGAGAAFGPWEGFLLASAGSILGSCAAFMLARHWLGDWARRRCGQVPAFDAVAQAVGREGWRIVVLTRLSPVLPLNLLSYAFGLTTMGLAEYAVASWVGRLPAMALYLYLGASATQARSLTPAVLALYAAGLGATVASVWLVAREAKRALSSKLSRA